MRKGLLTWVFLSKNSSGGLEGLCEGVMHAHASHQSQCGFYKERIKENRLQVVPLSLSLSCVTRKKTARKKWPRGILGARRMAALDPGGEKNAKGVLVAPRISRGRSWRPQDLTRLFLSPSESHAAVLVAPRISHGRSCRPQDLMQLFFSPPGFRAAIFFSQFSFTSRMTD